VRFTLKRNKPKRLHCFLQHKDSLPLSLVFIKFVLGLIYSLVLSIVNPCDLTIGIRAVSVLDEQWRIRGLVLQSERSVVGGLHRAGQGGCDKHQVAEKVGRPGKLPATHKDQLQ
jgi:hypothetical protein